MTASHATRLLAACREEFGKIEDPPGSGQFRDRTQAECDAEITVRHRAALKDLVLRVEREAAKKAAADGITEISLT
jgi:hypothetical protein